MDFKKYFQRINYTPLLSPSFEVLCELQKRHLLYIPFENLDIHYGTKIELDIENIFEKVVLQKRGGFCYELNGLYFELLKSIGFNVKRISARVFDGKNNYGPDTDHLALIVNIDDSRFLTDVGFGEFTFAPLKLELNKIQTDARGDFIMDQFDDQFFRVNKIVNGEPIPQYIFTTKERQFSDFKAVCHFHQTSSSSHFTQKKVISRPTENGRITLNDFLLKIKDGESVKDFPLKNEQEFKDELFNHLVMS